MSHSSGKSITNGAISNPGKVIYSPVLADFLRARNMRRNGNPLTMAVLILVAAILLPAMSAASETRGKITGGVLHETPAWFKDSFLEIADDVDDASEAGKHVLLFFELEGCPYCDRMLEESFEAEPLSSYIQANFDTIAINVKGDREIAFNEEISVTEKELGEILKVYSTPALLFLNADNKPSCGLTATAHPNASGRCSNLSQPGLTRRQRLRITCRRNSIAMCTSCAPMRCLAT